MGRKEEEGWAKGSIRDGGGGRKEREVEEERKGEGRRKKVG